MEQQQSQSQAGGPIFILAVDKSEHSDYAFKYYINEVHKPGNILHVVHCMEGWPAVHPMDGGPSRGHVQEMKAKDKEDVEIMRKMFTAEMQEHQIQGEFQVITAQSKHAWDDILKYQEKVGGVMIVMGSRGLGAIKRTFMGSVSDSVVHHAKVPVLVCRR